MNLPTKGNCSDGSSLDEHTDLNTLMVLEAGGQGQGTGDFLWGLTPCLSQPFPSLMPMGPHPLTLQRHQWGWLRAHLTGWFSLPASSGPVSRGSDLSTGTWRGTTSPQTGSGCTAHGRTASRSGSPTSPKCLGVVTSAGALRMPRRWGGGSRPGGSAVAASLRQWAQAAAGSSGPSPVMLCRETVTLAVGPSEEMAQSPAWSVGWCPPGQQPQGQSSSH